MQDIALNKSKTFDKKDQNQVQSLINRDLPFISNVLTWLDKLGLVKNMSERCLII